MSRLFDNNIQTISAFIANILSVIVIVSLHQEVSGNLYKGELNAVESVFFERLKCEHRSAQHCVQTVLSSSALLILLCACTDFTCAN